MAVTSLISPAGVLSARPLEALAPVRAAVDPRETPEESPEPRTSRGSEDLSRGLGPQQLRRLELMAGAEQLRRRVVAEEIRRTGERTLEQLDATETALRQVERLVRESRNPELPPENRSDLEQQARELATRIGSEVQINAEDGGAEIAELTGLGFQPGTLGLVAVRETAENPEQPVEALDAATAAALARVQEERERVRQRMEEFPPPERFGGMELVETTPERPERTEAEALITQEQAQQVVQNLREQDRAARAEALIHHLATLVPQNVAALIP
ncbi:MAG: hypothetical protein KatS3mg115_0700 [Candidatus Poribacteria bacterium]|nr:MAG: hypothetical protein KatS3mg115_0700 [Candidatus Poribacteria bacterium]